MQEIQKVKPASKPRSFKFLSPSGATMMEVEHVGRVGDRLVMRGKMMGEFPQEIYLPIEQFVTMVKMSLRLSTLQFLVLAPVLGLARLMRTKAASGQRPGPMLLVLSFLGAFLLVSPLMLPALLLAGVVAIAIFLFVGACMFLGVFRAQPRGE